MIAGGASPSVATVRDVVDFVIFPLIVALVVALLSFAVWIVRKLQDHSEALSLVLHELNPRDAPSLRTQLEAVRMDVTLMKAQPSNHGNP